MRTKQPIPHQIAHGAADHHREGPSEALASRFDLLSDETRLRIIAALYRGTDGKDLDRLSFSELCDRTGIRDTGQFNYHLNRLRDAFVEKRPDGYALTPAGVAVGRMLVAAEAGST